MRNVETSLIARTDAPNYLAAHHEHGRAYVSVVDEFGQSASVQMELADFVRFCRDSLKRVREAGTEVPE